MKSFSSLLRILSLVIATSLLVLSLSSCDVLTDVMGDIEGIIGGIMNPSDPEDPEDPADPEGPSDPEGPADPEDGYSVITIAEALELCGEDGNITTERYYIRGVIETVTNPQYGAMIISDSTGSISVYGTYSSDGALTYTQLEYQPVKGDEVLLHCILQNYYGDKEVKNARLIEYVNNQGNLDVDDYTSATIAEARAAAKGAALRVSGVVARITYAMGGNPNGFMLVDDTASIYVFDGDAAARVAIGNTVEIAGTKDYWILDKEMENAAKHGYVGCNQLTDVLLVSCDGGKSDFDTSWIKESTVKDILDTPVSEDITTSIYKVNALVKKAINPGFVNYYFFDLDETTGSYTYTQCNGDDFSWLDQFDGKICTVYLSALNAKSTAADCTFRFLPIAVYDEGFTFDLTKTPEHVMKYYALEQFATSYSGNPMLKLDTVISSALLGFENATISYTSDNEEAVSFISEGDELFLSCNKSGTATVTISVSYGGKTITDTVTIDVSIAENIDASTVEDAIAAEINDIVTVKGIVGPSVVNKVGFYLIDETGVIAVLVNTDAEFNGLTIGNEVVIEGKRDRFHNGKGDHAGQTCITAATVVANYYGSHEYDTSNFVTDITPEEFYALDKTVDYSTTVFVITAKVVLVKGGYSSNYKLEAGGTQITLYSSGEAQYNFLKPYLDTEVTVEIAACNWNNKSYWTGCVLSVITEDGKVYNQLNFTEKV